MDSRKDTCALLTLIAGLFAIGGAMYFASIAWLLAHILLLGFACFFPWSLKKPTAANIAGGIVLAGSALLTIWEAYLGGPGLCGIVIGITAGVAIRYYPWNGVVPNVQGNCPCCSPENYTPGGKPDN